MNDKQNDKATYLNSDHNPDDYESLLAAAIAAGVIEPDARPTKLALVNGHWYVTS